LIIAYWIISRYNTFVTMNILISDHPEEPISKLLSLIGQPARIQILLILGEQEACVCHLETVMGTRQASISQHLMVLRKAGLVDSSRDGRNVFYHLTRPEVVDVLKQAAQLTGSSSDSLRVLTTRPVPDCPCPQCNPDVDPKLTCQNVRSTRSSLI
jgi:DNA-binding transcriptional ArsR family regulator